MLLHKTIWMLTTTAVIALATPAAAQSDRPRDFDIAAQSLQLALQQVALQSGQQVIVPSVLAEGLKSKAIKGHYTAFEAISLLLRGTGLQAVAVGNTLVIQRETAIEGDGGGPDLLVTGTRIRGRGPVGSSVISIDRKAIDESGFATTQQILQSIPQNFGGGPNDSTSGTFDDNANLNATQGASINLRGLGASSTLVLLNGDRAPLSGYGGLFSDVSMIPVSAIERMEVIADGSSAIYGSDAVAGVVNIIPRLNFQGAETSLRYGSADGAAQEFQASQIVGTHWSGGHLVLAYEFYKRNRLRASDRDFATDDLQAFGGADHRTNYASPGTIYAGGTSFAIPAGQNGVGLTASQLKAGTVNLADSWDGADILPEQQRHSGFAALSQELGDGFRFYANGLLTLRRYDVRERPSFDRRRTVPVTNPFYVDPVGTHLPVGVNYAFNRDLGNETRAGRADGYGGTLGLQSKRGPWTIDLRGSWGKAFQTSDILNRVNTARLALALADTNPATAYNLFGDGPSTNPATIDAIRGSTHNAFGSVTWSSSLSADGPLFSLPAGDVRLAVGGEYRFEKFTDNGTISDSSTLTPVTLAPAIFPGARRVKAAYGELLVPVFGGGLTLPGFHRIDVSMALRTERYSDVGNTTNPKVGVSWEPTNGLTLRGTYGTSFRAPSFSELQQLPGNTFSFSTAIPDPRAPSGMANVIVLRGNDPNLRPEKATTWTLGWDLRPAALPGFHAGLTYFNIVYRDRIASAAAQLYSFLTNRSVYAGITQANPSPARVAALYAAPGFVDYDNISPTEPFAAVVDARLKNLSVVKETGLDATLEYATDLFGGRAEVGANATYILFIRQGLTANAPFNDVVNTLGNPVDLRGRGRLAWTSSTFGAVLFCNYVAGYTNTSNPLPQHVSPWTTFDLQLSYRFDDAHGPFKGLRLALNGTNLFDRDPPYAAYYIGSYGSAYDPENANPMKRVISFQVTKEW
ncbi:TonB-dependent receptor [Sphingomonas glacialis]|nr:TonB-dependent receptor [Sphingomonas glacialis]